MAQEYTDSWEHLQDELKLLDLLIRIHLNEFQSNDQQAKQPNDALECLKGLVITEDEINSLLIDENDLGVNEKSINQAESKLPPLIKEARTLQDQIARRVGVSIQKGVYLSLPYLSHLFDLTPLEKKIIIVCLAPELDRKYEKLYAYLQNDVTCKKPSIDLVFKLLSSPKRAQLWGREAFTTQSTLLKYGLIHWKNDTIDDPVPFLSRLLKLDDRIVNFLLESNEMDIQLDPIAMLVSKQTGLQTVTLSTESQKQVINYVRYLFKKGNENTKGPVFYFNGPKGSGKQAFVEGICYKVGLSVIVVDLIKMPKDRMAFEKLVWLLVREAMLQNAALCFKNTDSLPDYSILLEAIQEIAENHAILIFLLGTQALKNSTISNKVALHQLEFPALDYKSRKKYWENAGSGYWIADDVDWGALAGKFRFTPGQIQKALAGAQDLASLRSPRKVVITLEDIYKSCRRLVDLDLGIMTSKIQPNYTWEDIVLPEPQLMRLRQISSQIKYRYVVYDHWGFGGKLSGGKGLNVLFSGPSGTGKTMAAEVIANELMLDIYKIDLSQVVSKYIGETEKNLQQIFHKAKTCHAILFFDEADALFGKRSEVKDAHDRYANIEIAYLLQKMEEYEGMTILATNLGGSIDEAFIRRLQFHIEFPLPDEELRKNIWIKMFPVEAPKSDDIDYEFLAKKFKITGGNIKNIVLNGAFLAAEANEDISMKHIIKATEIEMQKIGKTCSPDEFEQYYDWIR